MSIRALSIRQPWAWAILHAGKRIENRGWQCFYRGPLLIHAAKGCTRDEYEDASAFIAAVSGLQVPPLEQLDRGGIVGKARVTGCVSASDSAWFCGRYGILLDDVRARPFMPIRGQLGLFVVEIEA